MQVMYLVRMVISINGIVQGVGFRPFIHKLVNEYEFYGWVKNTSNGVTMEVEGDEKKLSEFVKDIENKCPKLAVIENISTKIMPDLKYYKGFKIIKSTESSSKFTLISPDVCICDDCLRELFDKNNKRYRFPFINCTNCGPRFTIIKDVPYDRDKTTMKKFPMCPECESEYLCIDNRRYHAQPNCCFDCGPSLFFLDGSGREIDGDPIETARNYLLGGKIIAVKGLGGFHLACDAKNSDLVGELRRRKHRDEKAFAIMCRDVDTALKYCYVSESEKKLVEGFRRPIVLLKKRGDVLKNVSIDNNMIGIMLPYTPVHYLLMERDIDTLVMTSANISDFPIIYQNEEALKHLSGIADGYLMNNRDINVRCDDSVMMVFENHEYPVRRSRGYVPFPLKVSQNLEQILACGAEQKASFALSKKQYVFLSQHIGDMKNIETFEHYESQIEHFKRLFDITPEIVACDLHPDYMSTDYANEISKQKKLPLYYVQHHHAHLASCMADNNIDGDVIGIIWDGTGYGTDGTTWGGEFLTGGYNGFKRSGSILPVKLPGGDKAVYEISRIGIALLYETYGYLPVSLGENSDIVLNILENDINCPPASSIGRLFDGISAILNIKRKASYEGQGAIAVENSSHETDDIYEYQIENKNGMYLFDWRPMIKGIICDIKDNKDKGMLAAKFMNTLICMAVEISKLIKSDTGLDRIVLSGGVFQNMYLLKRLKAKLEHDGFKVYTHRRISTNDEGISIGQIMIAANGGGIYVPCSSTKNS